MLIPMPRAQARVEARRRGMDITLETQRRRDTVMSIHFIVGTVMAGGNEVRQDALAQACGRVWTLQVSCELTACSGVATADDLSGPFSPRASEQRHEVTATSPEAALSASSTGLIPGGLITLHYRLFLGLQCRPNPIRRRRTFPPRYRIRRDRLVAASGRSSLAFSAEGEEEL